VIKGRFEVNVNSQFALLCEHRFAPFFGVQFLGALNDNVFKNALVIMLAFQAANLTTLSSGLLVNLSAGLFILPFFLFSASAGQLADKYEKSRVIRFVKLLEIAIMALGAAGGTAVYRHFLRQNVIKIVEPAQHHHLVEDGRPGAGGNVPGKFTVVANHCAFDGGGTVRHFQADQHFVQRNLVGAHYGVTPDERRLLQPDGPFVVNAARRGVEIGVLPDENVPFFQPQSF
jgi:hypothetical protein